jgi:RNA polymerase sigma-70 factor, ECF subfamily
MADLHSLFREHYDRIWRLLRALGVPSDRIDDATQQVFLVYAERHRDVVAGSEGSFLYGTALRVAHNARGSRYREIPSDVEPSAPPDRPNADELSDQKRARDLLDQILGQMDSELRTVFVLYELEEFTVPEIAELTQLPLGTAASRLRRAREQFGTMVKRHTAAHSKLPPRTEAQAETGSDRATSISARPRSRVP